MDEEVYYHFLSADHAIDDLKKKRLKVSLFRDLNDVFELQPYLRYKYEKRQPYHREFERISNKWGMLCFSATREQQLMWAHYADKHRGIALGFAKPKGRLVKVCYPDSEIRTKIDLTRDDTENERRFLELAKVKSHDWHYEKEHRLLLELKECTCDEEKRRYLGCFGDDLRLREVVEEEKWHFKPFGDGLELREVVLGCRFDQNKRSQVQHLADRLGAVVIETREEWQGYKIKRKG